MLDVYVDASLGRRCGCAGVVFVVRAPLDHHRSTWTVPLPGGLTPNEGEMVAIAAAARLYRETVPSWSVSLEDLMVRIHTDSATCVRMLAPQPQVVKPDTRFGRMIKHAENWWTQLRVDRLCLGWTVRRVRREDNPAGAAASQGLRDWRKVF